MDLYKLEQIFQLEQREESNKENMLQSKEISDNNNEFKK